MEVCTRSCFANRKVLFYSTLSQRENAMSCSALRYQVRRPSNRFLSKQWKKQRSRPTIHAPAASSTLRYAATIASAVPPLDANPILLDGSDRKIGQSSTNVRDYRSKRSTPLEMFRSTRRRLRRRFHLVFDATRRHATRRVGK